MESQGIVELREIVRESNNHINRLSRTQQLQSEVTGYFEKQKLRHDMSPVEKRLYTIAVKKAIEDQETLSFEEKLKLLQQPKVEVQVDPKERDNSKFMMRGVFCTICDW